jgi:7,8-dihydro-6-hydroxymethylpterin-pyrophosphokinase
VNAVAGLVPRQEETPESLLKKLQALEKEFGRQPIKIPNAPRRLDLDLIAFGSETRNSPEIVLPHPRARRRKFVLQPLAEIAPDLVFPGGRQSVAELLAALPADETVVRTLSKKKAVRRRPETGKKSGFLFDGGNFDLDGGLFAFDLF